VADPCAYASRAVHSVLDHAEVPDPRGHHLLPQTYQRGFANAKGQVRIVDRATGEEYTTHMHNAFKRRDWNAVKDEDGKLDHTAELLLAEGIDTPASPGLQQLRAGDPHLAPEDQDSSRASGDPRCLSEGRGQGTQANVSHRIR
jgi:hypothetical protein